MLRKAKRLKQWIANPVSQGKDLDYWHFKCQDAKAKLNDIELQSEEWNIQFEQSRKMCLQAYNDISNGNRKLKRQAKHLYRLCENECAVLGNGSTNGGSTKTFTNKDLVEELARRDELYEKLQEEMFALIEEQAVTVTLTEEDCLNSFDDFSTSDPNSIKVKVEDNQHPINIKSEPGTTTTAPLSMAMEVTDDDAMKSDIKQEKDEDETNEPCTDRRHLTKQMIGILQQLQDFITRSESMENDVDWFFVEQDNLTMIESLIQKEFVTTNGKDNNKIPSISTNTTTNSSDLLAPPPPPPSYGSSAATEEKDAINQAFIEKILHAGKGENCENNAALQALANKVFDAMDPAGATTTRKKKQRVNPEQPLLMQTFPRHRTEIDLPLLLSPASCFEDRYMGVRRFETIFSPAIDNSNPDTVQSTGHEKLYHVVNPVPLSLQQLEDEIMERCQLQSEAAYTAEKIKKLQSSIVELQKMFQEATNARNRALQLLRLAEIEDQNDRIRMKNNLVQYGLLPGEIPVSSSGTAANSSSSTPIPPGAMIADAIPVVAEESLEKPEESAIGEEQAAAITAATKSKGGKRISQSRR